MAVAILMGMMTSACDSKVMELVKKEEPKVLSFDPDDSVQVDQLMRFYVEKEIIPKEALNCSPGENELYTFDCIGDDCFISNDFIDSASGTFFVEVSYETGSSGNNSIYICQRTEENFAILFSTEGQINSDLGEEAVVNGYKVVYVETTDHKNRIVFNGSEFTMEEIPSQDLVTQK